MNVEIGTKTLIFLFWEYLFRNFGILSLQRGIHLQSHSLISRNKTYKRGISRTLPSSSIIPPPLHSPHTLRARIFKRLRSPGNNWLVFLNVYKFGLWFLDSFSVRRMFQTPWPLEKRKGRTFCQAVDRATGKNNVWIQTGVLNSVLSPLCIFLSMQFYFWIAINFYTFM